ncbi:MAG: group 1 truncated hemoglobin [Xanthomonadales bacterium]|nr:group 1 truncated hemoglobin [Xanthomonadales bacterium]|tara:strand:+ start:1138 stop:1578 length:441 start_codon:yes stop_codon:yes gene_type:complete
MPCKKTALNFVLAALISLILVGCAGGRADDSLYQRLGGEQGVDRLVGELLDEVHADRRIAFLFEGTDRDNLHAVIVEQICAETGGPCTYRGLDMRAAHSGLDIRHDEFDAFVEDLIVAMERVGVPTPAQNRLLAIFAPMREKVVFQ